MTRNPSILTLALISTLGLVASFGCSEETNEPAGGAGVGGAATGIGGAVGVGGDMGAAGTPVGVGGDGGLGVGGADPGAGGTTDAGVGGATAAGMEPICGNTVAGTAIAKGVVCAAEDVQLCYKTCGPTNAGGFKSETCDAATGTYLENSTCIWTLADYSCYKVPDATNPMSASCPAATPQATMDCTIPACTTCTSASGMYLDSKGAEKSGYCTCVGYDAAAATPGKWSCGTALVAWPCPGNAGC